MYRYFCPTLYNAYNLTSTILFCLRQNKNVFVSTGQNTIAKAKKAFCFGLNFAKTKTKHKIVQVSVQHVRGGV